MNFARSQKGPIAYDVHKKTLSVTKFVWKTNLPWRSRRLNPRYVVDVIVERPQKMLLKIKVQKFLTENFLSFSNSVNFL